MVSRSGYTRSAPLTLSVSALNVVATLIAGIVVARVLGPSGKGDLARFIIFAALAFDLASFGTAEAVVVSVAQHPGNRHRLIRSLAAPTRLQGVVGVGIYLLLVVLAGIPELGLTVPLVAFALWVPLAIYMTRCRSYLLGRGDFRKFNATRLISEASPSAIIVLLAAAGQLSLTTTAMSYLLGLGTAWWFADNAMRSDWEGVEPHLYEDESAASFWSYARRNFVSVVAAKGNTSLDILILGLLAVPSVRLGEYSVATTAGMSIAIIGISFGMVALSRIGAVRRGTSPSPVLIPILIASSGLAIVATVVLWVVAPVLIPLIYGEAFAASVPIARILAIGGFALSTTHVLSASLRGMARPGTVAVAELSGALVTGLGIAVLGTQALEDVAYSATAGFGVTLALEAVFVTVLLRRLSRARDSI